MNGKRTSLTHVNLSGRKTILDATPPIVIDLQNSIINNIIIPLAASQWKIVNENLFLIAIMIPQLKGYIVKYNLPSLQMYVDILTVYNNVLNEHKQLLDLEAKTYGSNTETGFNIVYKLQMIKLKPEYDLYNLILGAPNYSNNEDYNPLIIEDIKSIMTYKNVTFEMVKMIITNKWKKA
jgi:hypothetical protein